MHNVKTMINTISHRFCIGQFKMFWYYLTIMSIKICIQGIIFDKFYFSKYLDFYLTYLYTHICLMQFFNFEPLISFLSFIFSFHQLWCTSFDQALRNFWLKAQLLKKWHMKLKRHHDIMYQQYKYTWNFRSILLQSF